MRRGERAETSWDSDWSFSENATAYSLVGGTVRDRVAAHWLCGTQGPYFGRFWETSDGPISAVSKPIFANKNAFFSIFRDLQDGLAKFSQKLQNFGEFRKILQNFAKFAKFAIFLKNVDKIAKFCRISAEFCKMC